MDTLELNGDGHDGSRVAAWMLFPKNPEMRDAHISREVTEVFFLNGRPHDDVVSIPIWLIKSLVEGPSKSELQDCAVEATKQGTVAGDLLSLVYEMHMRGVAEPSLGKALDEYKEYARGKRYGDGESLKISPNPAKSSLEL